MTEFDEAVLALAMDRVRAQELLDDPSYVSTLTTPGFLDLLLRAGYQPDEARRTTNERGWRRLAAGELL